MVSVTKLDSSNFKLVLGTKFLKAVLKDRYGFSIDESGFCIGEVMSLRSLPFSGRIVNKERVSLTGNVLSLRSMWQASMATFVHPPLDTVCVSRPIASGWRGHQPLNRDFRQPWLRILYQGNHDHDLHMHF